MDFWEAFGQAAGIALRGGLSTTPATALVGATAGAAFTGSEGVKKTAEELQKRVQEGAQGAADAALKPAKEFATLFAINTALVVMGLLGLWLIVRKA